MDFAVYAGDDCGGAGAGVVGWVFSEKNATISSMNPIQIRITPNMIIVSTAPISISRPAVPNIPTPDFEARRFRDFLTSMNAMMENANSTTTEIISPVRAVVRADPKTSMKTLISVICCDQVDGSAKLKPDMVITVRTVAAMAATKATTPTIAVITP